MMKKTNQLVSISGCGLALILIGCSSLDPQPFKQFAVSAKSAQFGFNAVMRLNYDWSRNGYAAAFVTDKKAKLSQIIVRPEQGYAWKWGNQAGLPHYFSVRETGVALAGLNDAFSKYAALLAGLADASPVNQKTFVQMAENLNQNASEALETLDIPAASKKFTIVSAAAIDAARWYIENRRKSYLVKAIRNNQRNVEKYSNLGNSLLAAIRNGIKAGYGKQMEVLKGRWQKNQDIEIVKQILELNEKYVKAMQTLQELEKAYTALPRANAELAVAVKEPELAKKSIKQLYTAALRIQQLYAELGK
ncbi:MAG: hypothetical protein PHH77_11155 [Victivallaceae bacterium]|nr:hypothetical protein [Victivallaceae bacterium]